jgi:hypothetical protein
MHLQLFPSLVLPIFFTSLNRLNCLCAGHHSGWHRDLCDAGGVGAVGAPEIDGDVGKSHERTGQSGG